MEMTQETLPTMEALVARPATPMTILEIAIQQGAGFEQLKQLWELQKDWEANEARKEYNEAIAQFKRNPPQINKNKHVRFGQTEYDHATLDHVTDQITQALSAVGISHRWNLAQVGDEITVTCILTHQRGHSESTPMRAKADTSGSKNSIQAIGSAVTYLQRYTLLAAVGLAAKGMDNDAATTESIDLTEEIEWIGNAKDIPELQKLFATAYTKAQKAKDKYAMHAVMNAKNKRKAELTCE
jgi:hypothetical protein